MNKLIYAILVALLPVAPTFAGVFSETMHWSSGDNAGQVAGVCQVTYPDERPLAVPRTLVVDKNTPDDTVLFSWGYDQFLSATTLWCVTNNISTSGYSALISEGTANMLYSFAPGSTGSLEYPTTNPGIKLRVLTRFNHTCAYNGTYSIFLTSILLNPGNTVSCPAAGAEFTASDTMSGSSRTMTQVVQTYNSSSEQRTYYPTTGGSISFRAELVKKGTVSYSGVGLSIGSSSGFQLRMGAGTNGYTWVSDLLSGSGINIIAPACQLKTTNYTITMGRWAADTTTWTGSPAYGALVPVNLALECSGKVDHVRFRFEDTGASASSNNNITLYDSAGGDKISGLEIEMQYNGSKVNVNNSDLTDTGSHGSTGVIDSASTAPFTARYVQNGTITRNGANYTGPVTGKVNMYVTYD